jgi:hypothetical protein
MSCCNRYRGFETIFFIFIDPCAGRHLLIAAPKEVSKKGASPHSRLSVRCAGLSISGATLLILRQRQPMFEHQGLSPASPPRFATSALVALIDAPRRTQAASVRCSPTPLNNASSSKQYYPTSTCAMPTHQAHFASRLRQAPIRIIIWNTNVFYSTGGEACGYRRPKRVVFKHLRKLPQHEERRTTNGSAARATLRRLWCEAPFLASFGASQKKQVPPRTGVNENGKYSLTSNPR